MVIKVMAFLSFLEVFHQSPPKINIKIVIIVFSPNILSPSKKLVQIINSNFITSL